MKLDTLRKFLRRSFPGLYRRFGRYFHTHYPLQRRILRHARRHPELYADPGQQAALSALASGPVSVFSFPGCEHYDTLPVEVHLDPADPAACPWVDHRGKRLYFRRGTPAESVARSYRALLREQDCASPHCYRADGFEPREGDVVLDVGCAEGIFALDAIGAVAHAVLFEVDPGWIDALRLTFAPWSDKVTIINKFAADSDGPDSVTVDTAVAAVAADFAAGSATQNLPPLLLKLDVEGAEERVLAGASRALSLPSTRAIVCTYHREGDHARLSGSMRARGFSVADSAGWMLFVHDPNLRPPFFRRGLIYCKREL